VNAQTPGIMLAYLQSSTEGHGRRWGGKFRVRGTLKLFWFGSMRPANYNQIRWLIANNVVFANSLANGENLGFSASGAVLQCWHLIF
jgi:hypothetical protein